MEERVFALARTLTGAGEADAPLLEALCAAALAAWSGRLRQDVAPGCEEALVRAAGFSAAADYLAGAGGGTAASFTAGDISVKGLSAEEKRSAAAALRRTAEQLMASYAVPEDICLKGVPG